MQQLNTAFLSEQELILLRHLVRTGTKFLVVGLSAAVLQGADVVTQDLDLWFESIADPGIADAARRASGVFMWRADPPTIAGEGLDRVDVVIRCDGLGRFGEEYANAIVVKLVGLKLKVLPLERVIVSKKAAGRLKDKAVIPALLAALAAIKRK